MAASHRGRIRRDRNYEGKMNRPPIDQWKEAIERRREHLGIAIAYIESLEAERATLAASWGKHQDLCVCDTCVRACEIITRVNHEGKYK